jgi:ABC-type transporter Mla MlaB component
MADTGPHAVAFTIRGPISRDDLPGLCTRVRKLLAKSPTGVVLCDVDGVDASAVTVDALARLQLAARAYGCRVRLCYSSDELLELVELMGLTDVICVGPMSSGYTPSLGSDTSDKEESDGRN